MLPWKPFFRGYSTGAFLVAVFCVLPYHQYKRSSYVLHWPSLNKLLSKPLLVQTFLLEARSRMQSRSWESGRSEMFKTGGWGWDWGWSLGERGVVNIFCLVTIMFHKCNSWQIKDYRVVWWMGAVFCMFSSSQVYFPVCSPIWPSYAMMLFAQSRDKLGNTKNNHLPFSSPF